MPRREFDYAGTLELSLVELEMIHEALRVQKDLRTRNGIWSGHNTNAQLRTDIARSISTIRRELGADADETWRWKL